MDIFTNPVKGVEVLERIKLCHDLLTEIRKHFKAFEKDLLSLEGKEIGELTVLKKSDRVQVIDGAETHFMGWKCHCTCGETTVVDHIVLLEMIEDNSVHCGAAVHGL